MKAASTSLVVTLMVLSTGCATTPSDGDKKPEVPGTATVASAPTHLQSFTVDTTRPMPAGLDETAMDLAADPCTDFYQYACGGWLKATEIPADKPGYSRGFNTVADKNELALKAILDEAAKNALPKGTPFSRQLGDYHATCMDEAKLEATLPEVKKFIASMTRFKNTQDLAKVLATLHENGFGPFFGLSSMQDLKNSSEVILGLDQGGLGLPDRDYYTDTDPKKQAIREAYVTFIADMLTLLGKRPSEAKTASEQIMMLETRLAKASQTLVERRDPNKLYNRINRSGLLKEASTFSWEIYFGSMNAKHIDAINVNSVSYFKEFAAAANDTPFSTLKDYVTWNVLRGAVPALPKRFQERHFAFVSKNFTGATEDRPRWKKCVAYADSDLGEALGREFVRRLFPESAKTKTSKMIEELQASVAANFAELPWMDEPTRTAALAKLKRMVGNNKIGYPERWRDYAKLQTTRRSFFSNSLGANRFEFRRQLGKVGKPVDRTEWYMSPQTVNAYYDPQKNEIVFSAGILQPPFFNQDATDAVNFGSMGMVVGHEITHGFDDEGRQFDVDGSLKDWWSPQVSTDFTAKASCIKDQFAGYNAIDDIKIKGDLTLGENIADLGGLKLSFRAMASWHESKKATITAEGARFDEAQQFFLGFAQSWCSKWRPEMSRMRAAVDPHSPPAWRVKGPVQNLEAFRTAFQCGPTAPMVRTGAAQCAVW